MLATQSFFKNDPKPPNYDRPGDGEYTVDGNTLLLLHGNGNGTDSSSNSHTATANGAASFTSSGVVKLGSGALDCAASTIAADYFSVTPHADWNFGTDPFTIDFWYYGRNTQDSNNVFLISDHNTNGEIKIRVNMAGGGYNIEMTPTGGGSQFPINCTPSGNIQTATWTHMALVRTNNTFTLWHNGAAMTSNTVSNSGGAGRSDGVGIRMGTRGISTQNFNGLLDEVRVSDVARWTSSFTVY